MKLRKASALFMAAAMSASMFVVPAAADETEDPAKAIPEDVIPDETVTLYLTSWQTIQVSRSVGLDRSC